ncbi:MAG: NAD(+)/NADH kinase [Eubacterium sp.]|nr:NAD(+)/NADH kinase [Eubacterium sp.]
MNEVGIYLNCSKAESLTLARQCQAYLKKRGITVAFLKDQIQEDEDARIYDRQGFFSQPDCLIVLGGDGTLLSVARASCIKAMPLFGINVGKLGFLTEGEAGNYERLLERLIDGEYYVEKRMMLSCRVKRHEDGVSDTYIALNDVLIKNAGFRMMDIKALAGDAVIDTFRADGLIISSPTGSTAYSLAAGGPVVAPGTDVMVVNPVCPHRLHDRAYVISADEKITARFDPQESDIIVSIDGQTMVAVDARDEVCVERALHTANLIRLNGVSFYERLRNKLSADVLDGEHRR